MMGKGFQEVVGRIISDCNKMHLVFCLDFFAERSLVPESFHISSLKNSLS